MIDYGHWTCNIPFVSAYGFVYVIENLINNKKYIGKKQMQTIKKLKPLKGKKNKRHFVIETDWRNYMSSSNELLYDIEKNGKNNFKFEILRFCQSKSELAYFEAKEQFDREVLLRDDYYNGIINLRIGKIKNISKIPVAN
jgi:hypothetical protein